MRTVHLLLAPLILWGLAHTPPAAAAGCPHVEVVFARGTDQPPGVGDVGQRFINSLTRKAGGVTAYAVNYPASKDYPVSTAAGVADANHRIQTTATTCPATRIVLGGYSQGAAVTGFATSEPINPDIADHVAAVVLYGTPNDDFLNTIGVPNLTIGPLYAAKTDQLCNPGDPVCSNGTDWAAHTYTQPQADAGATYAAEHL